MMPETARAPLTRWPEVPSPVFDQVAVTFLAWVATGGGLDRRGQAMPGGFVVD